jgi:AraC-like DNA-binding protein
VLLARGSVSIGDGNLRWTVAFAPRLWCSAYVQSGLVVDTRLIAPSSEPPRETACVCVILSGALRSHAGSRWDAPTALILSGQQLDGADGTRNFTYSLAGDAVSVVELNLWTKDLLVRPQAVPPTVDLDDAILEAVRELHAYPDDVLEEAIERLLRYLADRRVLSPPAVEAMLQPTSTTAALLWSAFRPMTEGLYLNPTMQEVGALTGLSTRVVARYVEKFVGEFGLAGGAWRASTHYLRLRLAAILMTAEGATASEVALRVGYRSSDAMARAFRDAGMLAPTEIKARARAE